MRCHVNAISGQRSARYSLKLHGWMDVVESGENGTIVTVTILAALFVVVGVFMPPNIAHWYDDIIEADDGLRYEYRSILKPVEIEVPTAPCSK